MSGFGADIDGLIVVPRIIQSEQQLLLTTTDSRMPKRLNSDIDLYWLFKDYTVTHINTVNIKTVRNTV